MEVMYYNNNLFIIYKKLCIIIIINIILYIIYFILLLRVIVLLRAQSIETQLVTNSLFNNFYQKKITKTLVYSKIVITFAAKLTF